MSGRIAHEVTETSVFIALRPEIGAPMSMHVSPQEAKRFCWALLADLDAGDDDAVAEDEVKWLELNTDERQATINGHTVALTGTEFTLLRTLAAAGGRTVSKGHLYDTLYNQTDEPEVGQKIVDVFVCKVRKKLATIDAAHHLETVWATGYRLVENPAPKVAKPAQPLRAPVRHRVLAVVATAPATFAAIRAGLPDATVYTLRATVTSMIHEGLIENRGDWKSALYFITEAGRARLPKAAA